MSKGGKVCDVRNKASMRTKKARKGWNRMTQKGRKK